MCGRLDFDRTERIPQKWHIQVPTVKEYQTLSENHDNRETSYLRRDTASPSLCRVPRLDLFGKLVRYGINDTVLPNASTILHQYTQKHQNTPLLTLPSEILLEILRLLGRIEIINLAVTCQHLFKIALIHIEDDIKHTSGGWAGHALAMMGSYATSLPPSFFENGLAYSSVSLTHLIRHDFDNGVSWQSRRGSSRLIAGSNSRFLMGRKYCPARQWMRASIMNYRDAESVPSGSKPWRMALCEVMDRYKMYDGLQNGEIMESVTQHMPSAPEVGSNELFEAKQADQACQLGSHGPCTACVDKPSVVKFTSCSLSSALQSSDQAALQPSQDEESNVSATIWQGRAISEYMPMSLLLAASSEDSISRGIHNDAAQEGVSSSWYLRNLNTRQVVQICNCIGRSHASMTLGSSFGDTVVHFSLDDLMAMQTRWTKATPPLLCADQASFQGPWAGHSFDVISVSEHEEHHGKIRAATRVTASHDWEDVTIRILLKALWEQYRAAGREELRHHIRGESASRTEASVTRCAMPPARLDQDIVNSRLEAWESYNTEVSNQLQGQIADAAEIVDGWRSRLQMIRQGMTSSSALAA